MLSAGSQIVRRPLRFLRDVKNLVQAEMAVRNKRWYLPSLFGHYTVNSVCNLRCSYCYVAQPEIYPEGFSNRGLPLDRAKKVLATLRDECLFLRFQGGEPLLYNGINELARYAKRELRYWHVSVITNGLLLAKHPDRYGELLSNIDLLTISLDNTRRREYAKEMDRLEAFLPQLSQLCADHRISLTRNYTATWQELEDPQRLHITLSRYGQFFETTYIMPVRLVGKTPLPLLKNSLQLNRVYSLGRYSGPEYPEVENVQWYREHCDPKLKIKVDANGGLVYPCENHSYSAGSLEHHTVRELWMKQPGRYPNESCMGCGKQRFRSFTLKHPTAQLVILKNLAKSRRPASARQAAQV